MHSFRYFLLFFLFIVSCSLLYSQSNLQDYGLNIVVLGQSLNHELLTKRNDLLAQAQILPYTAHYIDFFKKGNPYFEWNTMNTEMQNFWEMCEKQTELKIVEEMSASGHYSIFVEFPNTKEAYNLTPTKPLSLDYQNYIASWGWTRFGNSLPVYLHLETEVVRKGEKWEIVFELLPNLNTAIDSLTFKRMEVAHQFVTNHLNNDKFVRNNVLRDKEITNVPLIVTVQNELLRWIYPNSMCITDLDTIGIKPIYSETGYNPMLFQLNKGQISNIQLYFSQPFGNYLTCELLYNRWDDKHYAEVAEGATFCFKFEPNSSKIIRDTVRCGVYN